MNYYFGKENSFITFIFVITIPGFAFAAQADIQSDQSSPVLQSAAKESVQMRADSSTTFAFGDNLLMPLGNSTSRSMKIGVAKPIALGQSSDNNAIVSQVKLPVATSKKINSSFLKEPRKTIIQNSSSPQMIQSKFSSQQNATRLGAHFVKSVPLNQFNRQNRSSQVKDFSDKQKKHSIVVADSSAQDGLRPLASPEFAVELYSKSRRLTRQGKQISVSNMQGDSRKFTAIDEFKAAAQPTKETVVRVNQNNQVENAARSSRQVGFSSFQQSVKGVNPMVIDVTRGVKVDEGLQIYSSPDIYKKQIVHGANEQRSDRYDLSPIGGGDGSGALVLYDPSQKYQQNLEYQKPLVLVESAPSTFVSNPKKLQQLSVTDLFTLQSKFSDMLPGQKIVVDQSKILPQSLQSVSNLAASRVSSVSKIGDIAHSDLVEKQLAHIAKVQSESAVQKVKLSQAQMYK